MATLQTPDDPQDVYEARLAWAQPEGKAVLQIIEDQRQAERESVQVHAMPQNGVRIDFPDMEPELRERKPAGGSSGEPAPQAKQGAQEAPDDGRGILSKTGESLARGVGLTSLYAGNFAMDTLEFGQRAVADLVRPLVGDEMADALTFDDAHKSWNEYYRRSVDIMRGEDMGVGFELAREIVPYLVTGTAAATKIAGTILGKTPFMTGMTSGAIADFTMVNPEEGNIATMFREMDMLPDYLEFMTSDSYDEEMAGRLVSTIEGAAVGTLLEPVIRGIGATGKSLLKYVRETHRASMRSAEWSALEQIANGDAEGLSNLAKSRIGLGQSIDDFVADMVERGYRAEDAVELYQAVHREMFAPKKHPGGKQGGHVGEYEPPTSQNEHQMEVKRKRSKAVRTTLSKEEKEIIGGDKELEKRVRTAKGRASAGEGWAPLKLIGTEVSDSGTVKPVYQKLAYGFNRDPKTGKPNAKTEPQRISKVARQLVKDFREVEARAAAGDYNATVIMRQAKWYANMRTRLRQEFGSLGDTFADLLGATSAKTPVPLNWRSSVEALRNFTAGKYDEELKQFAEHLDAGGKVSDYAGPVILKDNGTKFGSNTKATMKALLDLWRVSEPGSAPKTYNFTGNLIGYSNKATIDVWAARSLTRLAGDAMGKKHFPRIPPAAEQPVTGAVNASGTDITGEFGFGQKAFAEASEELGIPADDLQAIVWFREKELWVKNGWSTAEGGSFEEQADISGFRRFDVGLTSERNGHVPDDAELRAVAKPITDKLNSDQTVTAFTASPSVGRYYGADERALDLQWVANPDHDPTEIVREVARAQMEHGQYDSFVSRVLKDDEIAANPNARPGMEVYFKEGLFGHKLDQPTIDRVEQILRWHNIPGFTIARDTRDPSKVVGIRFQWIPEISARWDDEMREAVKDPAKLEAMKREQSKLVGLAANDILEALGEKIGSAHAQWYDTTVIGHESAEAVASGAANPGSRGFTGFGRSIGENVEAFTRSLDPAVSPKPVSGRANTDQRVAAAGGDS